MSKEQLHNYFESITGKKDRRRWLSRFYHRSLERELAFIIPPGSRVLEIGSGTGDLLNAVNPSYGLGIDFSRKAVELSTTKYPHLHFIEGDAEELPVDEKFDYIMLSDLVGSLWDVQKAFANLRKVSGKGTRIIITYYNFLWEPLLRFAEWTGLKRKQPIQSWLSSKDIESLLCLEDFETIRTERLLLLPVYIPLLHFIFNKILARLPLIEHLCLTFIKISRPAVAENRDYTVSIVVPARNERGNIEQAILRTPPFGKAQEFVFIEGHSGDGTWDEIQRVKTAYPGKQIVTMQQTGKGKGNAVREAFDAATGEILMILDADLTMPPEDLPKYYEALRKNKGEFINGSRLIYPMEKESMRFLNLLGNKFFSLFFTYLLGQRLKDTLCGTKVLFHNDYNKIRDNRHFFGDFDPFGDFDLLFGAAKLNLKITEIPIRYKERVYGSTQIRRFAHGWLLIRMSFFAASRLKFR